MRYPEGKGTRWVLFNLPGHLEKAGAVRNGARDETTAGVQAG